MTQLQQDMTEQKNEMKKQLEFQTEQRKLHMEKKLDELSAAVGDQKQLLTEQNQKLNELKGCIRRVDYATHHLRHKGSEPCPDCKIITFEPCYCVGVRIPSNPSYFHQFGYTFRLEIEYHVSDSSSIDVFLSLEENFDQIQLPMTVNICLELLDQAGDRHDVREISNSIMWGTRNELHQAHYLGTMKLPACRPSITQPQTVGIHQMFTVVPLTIQFRVYITISPRIFT